MKTNLSDHIYDQLIKEFGNDLIHSHEKIEEIIKSDYTEKEEEIKREVQHKSTMKGFLGIPKTVINKEIVTEIIKVRSKTTYSFSYNEIKNQLQNDEFIVFSIGGGVYFTNLRIIFYNGNLYEVKKSNAYDEETIVKLKKYHRVPYIEDFIFEEIIELHEKGKKTNIHDGLDGGSFYSEENPYSENTHGDFPQHYDFTNSYGTNYIIAYGRSSFKDGWEYGDLYPRSGDGNDYTRYARSFIKFPNKDYLNLGNKINSAIDNFISINVKHAQNNILADLDKDNNGIVDSIENNDFGKLLTFHQKKIININRDYVHNFVKISNYLNTKKKNIQSIFDCIKKSNSYDILNQGNILKNHIHNYESLLFHSINMIVALIEDDMITFYEIYETLDKLGIFNSNWENEISEKLSTIGDKLDDLLLSIYEMENKIVSEISNLTYVTQESFGALNDSVSTNLKSIKSSIDVNNLFTAISTYQLYKINKQTKPLLPK